MRIDVALTPALITDIEQTVCIVVDVLRASSACVAMFDSGIEAIAIAANPEAARALRASSMPDAILCGETGGLPPSGFDHGNSPMEFSRLPLAGRSAVLATSNGTRALHAVVCAPAVLVGCLRNRDAIASAALVEARRASADILVVCAGNDYGATFSLDDAVAAGAIVQSVRLALARHPASEELAMTDAAITAERLFEAYASEPVAAFREGTHGRALERLGFGADLEFCAALDGSRCVPYLSVEGDGILVLRKRPG